MPVTTYQDLLTHLDRLGMFHMDFGLERMERGLRALDLRSPPYVTAQIVGTNGKGSTSSFLAALAAAHGVTAGLFTSPHMISPRERIRVNGETLSEERWVDLARRVVAACPDLTYFESLCLMAALAFAEEGVGLAVMEAGLGGRSDATSALPADLVCFTSVGLDHRDVLGDSLREIARDKAAAMRAQRPAITVRQDPEVIACLREAGRRTGGPLLRAEDLCAIPDDWKLGLAGAHQYENAALALAAWRELARRHGWPADEAPERAGLENAWIAGRLQAIPSSRALPDLLLDGAHNTPAFTALRKALRDLDIAPRAVVFSCLADKDLEGILPLVRELAPGAPLLVPPCRAGTRAAAPERLAAGLGGAARAMPGLAAALDAARELARDDAGAWNSSPRSPILVCGSLYLLAEFFTLYPALLHNNNGS